MRSGSTASTTAIPISPSFQPRGTPQRFNTDCWAQTRPAVQTTCQNTYGPKASGVIKIAAIGG